jgi:hypothetical protein
VGQYFHSVWPGEIRDIVFVVGAPRSGTSIFGQIMSQHPDFLYVHEPRYIWRYVEPKLNVWQDHPTHGKLYWDSSDVDEHSRRSLARWFHLELTLGRRRRLIEKMPLNVFRLRWLAATFPQARFIHILRHGCDVALSLKQAIEQRWFSPERGYAEGYWESSRHYLMFEAYAADKPGLQDKLPIVTTYSNNYARSIFVWLCCTWEGRQAGKELGEGRYIEVRYEDLVLERAAELSRLLAFLGESGSLTVAEYANSVLHRRSIRKPDPNPEATQRIAGEMLAELGYEV